VDANAVAPETARKVGEVVTAAGATFVDGGIIGPPPRRPGLARLYLSGSGAARVAAQFREGLLEAIPLAIQAAETRRRQAEDGLQPPSRPGKRRRPGLAA